MKRFALSIFFMPWLWSCHSICNAQAPFSPDYDSVYRDNTSLFLSERSSIHEGHNSLLKKDASNMAYRWLTKQWISQDQYYSLLSYQKKFGRIHNLLELRQINLLIEPPMSDLLMPLGNTSYSIALRRL